MEKMAEASLERMGRRLLDTLRTREVRLSGGYRCELQARTGMTPNERRLCQDRRAEDGGNQAESNSIGREIISNNEYYGDLLKVL
jgi:hypothetical protein